MRSRMKMKRGLGGGGGGSNGGGGPHQPGGGILGMGERFDVFRSDLIEQLQSHQLKYLEQGEQMKKKLEEEEYDWCDGVEGWRCDSGGAIEMVVVGGAIEMMVVGGASPDLAMDEQQEGKERDERERRSPTDRRLRQRQERGGW
ncbi:hypothetical protein Drorol1_Dr00001996 [Drosera rotundifolia]